MPADTGPSLDFSDFERWYSARRHRTTGAPAKPTTLKTKRTHLRTACKETGCGEPVSLAHLLTDRSRAEYLLDRLAMRMTPGAMRSAVEALRQYGEFAQVAGLTTLPCTLTRADVPPKNPAKAITVYSADEVDRLVFAARGKGLRWWAFVATLADTGRRVGEVLSLRWEWLRLEQPVSYFELPYTKNGEAQYMPLPRRLVEQVYTPANVIALKREARGTFGGTFQRSPLDHPFPWNYCTVLGRFERYCRDVGVPYRGMHTLRHTTITRRIAEGMPIQAVASLAGHASPTVTLARYAHATSLEYAARYLD